MLPHHQLRVVLQRLLQMRRLYLFAACQVRDRADIRAVSAVIAANGLRWKQTSLTNDKQLQWTGVRRISAKILMYISFWGYMLQFV